MIKVRRLFSQNSVGPRSLQKVNSFKLQHPPFASRRPLLPSPFWPQRAGLPNRAARASEDFRDEEIPTPHARDQSLNFSSMDALGLGADQEDDDLAVLHSVEVPKAFPCAHIHTYHSHPADPSAPSTANACRTIHLEIKTSRGVLPAIFYEPSSCLAPALMRGVLLLPGMAKDSGAEIGGGLFHALGQELRELGVRAILPELRVPQSLEESFFDADACLRHLTSLGVQEFALVGHGRGAAVALRLAARSPGPCRAVAALSPLAPQRSASVLASCGASQDPARSSAAPSVGPAAAHSPSQSLLIVHGVQDRVTPPGVAQDLYEAARLADKRVVYLGAGGHMLNETEGVRSEVHAEVLAFVRDRLGVPARAREREREKA